jgi:hypothetical protein
MEVHNKILLFLPTPCGPPAPPDEKTKKTASQGGGFFMPGVLSGL